MKQAKTIREAIKRLPEINKLWVLKEDAYIVKYGRGLKLILGTACSDENTITELHAAALTFGYEIGWLPVDIKTYKAFIQKVSVLNDPYDCYYFGEHKTIDKAIEAAFVGAVNDKLKEMRK